MGTLTWDLLEGLFPEDRNAVLNLAEARTYQDGEEIFALGAEAETLFLVETGSVKLTLPLTIGDNQVDAMVGERGPGHMVGWSGLIPPHRFTVKAVAVADTRVLRLRRGDLLDLFDRQPRLGRSVYGNVSRIIGQRLQVFQTLWIREMQHVVRTKSL